MSMRMHPATKALLGGALAFAVLVAAMVTHRSGADPASAQGGGMPRLTSEQRSGSLRFAPDVAPADRQVVLQAIASARPEARRLIDVVDGAVTVEVQATGGGNAGWTAPTPTGYDVALDLGSVSQRLGPRGVERLVLHELGHVVDFALVPDELVARLDAEIPQGYGPCVSGQRDAACTQREERFAETFSKWATGDIGAGLNIGYRVPPPDVSLEEWGAPLTSLPG